VNPVDLLGGHPAEVAPGLLGWTLTTQVAGSVTSVVIREVEAYSQDDPASHAFRGRTRANGSMFAGAGTLYVYRSYGIHWCANVVTGPVGEGAAILIRGGQPLRGESLMGERRGRANHLTDGPGKLCQALGIDGSFDGTSLFTGPVRLAPGPAPAGFEATPRIGIARAVDVPWRFVAIDA